MLNENKIHEIALTIATQLIDLPKKVNTQTVMKCARDFLFKYISAEVGIKTHYQSVRDTIQKEVNLSTDSQPGR